MIKATKLPRHRYCQKQQATYFSWSLESQARAERSDIDQARHFSPVVTQAFATVDSDRQRQGNSLAQPPRLFFAFCSLVCQEIIFQTNYFVVGRATRESQYLQASEIRAGKKQAVRLCNLSLPPVAARIVTERFD